jgi:hypothetical protein
MGCARGTAWRQRRFGPYGDARMDALSAFGLFAVTAMMVCYALEPRSHCYTLGFAVACGLGSIYGFLQGAWPFGVVEAVWMVVALHKWHLRRHR